jgi:two-component system LytT family response regulator
VTVRAVTVRALIVEDEPPARQRLRELLDDVPWVSVVGEAADGAAAVRAIDALEPDLVFLDIQLPECTGLQVLERAAHSPAVIFTTAYGEHAVAAFELEALDYLLKPFGRARLAAALERARRALAAGAPEATVERARRALGDDGAPLSRLLVRDRGRIVPLLAREIERLEAEDDCVAIVARGRRYLVEATLGDVAARLDPERFVQLHRSHVVNLDFVQQLTPYDGARLQVEMRDGTHLLASRARSKVLRHLAI